MKSNGVHFRLINGAVNRNSEGAQTCSLFILACDHLKKRKDFTFGPSITQQGSLFSARDYVADRYGQHGKFLRGRPMYNRKRLSVRLE